MRIYSAWWRSGEESHCAIDHKPAAGGRKAAVCRFTQQSRTRLRRYLENTPHVYCVLMTLTYAWVPTCGQQCKSDLKNFHMQLRRRGVMPRSALWIMEFQRRGALHYHLFSTDYIDKYVLSDAWSAASGNPASTSTNVQAIRKPISYALKYASKLEQKIPPIWFQSGGRFWGILGCRCRYELERSWHDSCHDDAYGQLKYAEKLAEGKRIWRHRRGFLAFAEGGSGINRR